MYEKFYHFREKPFNVTPDPRFFYLGEHHEEALAHLTYGISERKGFIVITGEVGTGKTTLIHTLLERLNGSVKTALIFNPNLTLQDFFLSLLNEFDLKVEAPTKANFLIEFNNFLIGCLKKNENVVLIIDEAQNLTPSVLEEIRLLLNLETSNDKLLQVVLAGQPELSRKLNLPELRQLKQRISVRYHIPPLQRREVEEYIIKRLRTAGSQNFSIFTKKAIDEIFNYSRGIPRLINVLCDNSLLVGYATEQTRIDHKIIRECIDDLEVKVASFTESGETARGVSGKSFKITGWLAGFALFFLCLTVAVINWWNPEVFEGAKTMIRGIFPHYTETIDKGGSKPSQAEPNIISPLAPKIVEISPPDSPEPKTDLTLPPPVIGKGEGNPPKAVLSEEEDLSPVRFPMDTLIKEPDFSGDSKGIQGSRGKEDQPLPPGIVVKKGDLLSGIVLKRYGQVNDRILSMVQQANPIIKDLNYLEIGWLITLPDLNEEIRASNLFSVHIASFKDFNDAYALFSSLADVGYEVYLIPVNILNRGHWYRITLGKFDTLRGASSYAKRLLANPGFQYAHPLHIEESMAMEIEK